MGLFSSSKKQPPKIEIPAEILADVSVNGEKKVDSSPQASATPLQPLSNTAPSATSPFLKTKTPDVNIGSQSETQILQQERPDSTTPPNLPVEKEKEVPKSFNFSDQSPLPSEIHFTDVPGPKPEQGVRNNAPSVSERPDFSQITQDKALTERHREHLKPLKVGNLPENKGKKSLWSSSNLLSLIVFLLILIFISGGSWYYLNTRNSQGEPAPNISIGDLGQTPLPTPGPKPTEGALLVDQPNYLTLDIETATLEQIQGLLNTEAQKMMSQNITIPVEYLAVDMNNNPVAFSRFAFLIGADNPNTLVEASLEPFSLYLFMDNGSLRLALAIPLKENIGASFPTDKSVLPESLKKFFYPEPFSGNSFANTVFSQSSYKDNAISYTNIDESKNISLDMTLQEGILTVANSKNTLRAVIDKRTLPTQ